MNDMSDKSIFFIIGGTILFILLVSAFFIAGDFGVNFVDALFLLAAYFIGPVLLLVISYSSVVLLSTYTQLKISETPIGSIVAFFAFCFLLVFYGAVLGHYPIELITNNIIFLVPAFAFVAIVSYFILKVKQMIFGGQRSI